MAVPCVGRGPRGRPPARDHAKTSGDDERGHDLESRGENHIAATTTSPAGDGTAAKRIANDGCDAAE